MITRDMSMAQAIMENHQIIPLLPRFNISMGLGEATIDEVCENSSVSVEFFLEICNAYINEEHTAQEGLSPFSLDVVIEYLKNTHKYYTEIAMPELERNIHSLVYDSELSEQKKELVSTFFNDYKNEFLSHIQKEELEIIPYIHELEKQCRKKRPDSSFIEKINNYSINDFAREHDPLEDSLTNLSKLIIKYLPPFKNQALCNHVLVDLARLVEDLADHAAIEDRVLIPKVAELEQALLNNKQNMA